MNRANAERVFVLVAELHGDLHDRFIPDRWWLVWILMGLEIAFTNCLTQFLINRDCVRPILHFTIFTVQVLALAITILVVQRHLGGARSQRESFIWWIWTTFLLAASIAVLLNLLLELPLFALAAVLPLLAAVAFSTMAMVVDTHFIWAAELFALCSIAMAVFPSAQFYIYGGAWVITLESFGCLHRPRSVKAGHTL